MATVNASALRLLQAYTNDESDSQAVSKFTDQDVDFLYESGVGTLLFHEDALGKISLTESQRELVLGADLTARVICRQISDVTVEVLDRAAALRIPVALLKGIWIAHQFYPQAHHRTMGDVDLLVPPESAQQLYDDLLEHGFEMPPDAESRTPVRHHHLPELRHSATGVPVEIHTGLISRTMLTEELLFRDSELWKHAEPSRFQSCPCHTLSLEFQLLYTISHWAIDYKWPTNLISINDVILLMKSRTPAIDWNRVSQLMTANAIAADMLTVLMLFLDAHRLCTIPPAIMDSIRDSQRRIGRRNIAVLHWLMIRFPMSGRRKVGWAISRLNARVIWLTLLEPRNSFLRLPAAIWRVLSRRTHGKSLLGSTAGRIRTLLQPND